MIPFALIAFLLAADPEKMEWKVGDVTREALVGAPSKKSDDPPPLVFVFHGHGGRMDGASKSFNLQKEWPEAVVVYMQGLPTPGITDPDGKKPGWQKKPGDQDDRDLKFFDAVLASMKEKHKVDEKRIYAMGHSNGGAFTYLLYAERNAVFAAIAPSGSGSRPPKEGLRAVPLLHVAGEKDELVPIENQKRTIEAFKTFNGCEAEGREWAKDATIYASSKGAPVVTFLHGGGHSTRRRRPPSS